MLLKKQLVAAGNTWQLYINKPIVKLMGINKEECTVLLRIENKSLIVQKIKNEDIDIHKNNALIKKLIKRTSGYGLNLTQPIIELLEIDPEKDLILIDIDKNTLTIKKA